jgi:outer membrane protein
MTRNALKPAAWLLVLAAGLAPTFAHAQNAPWLVRLRAVNLDSANGGSTTPNLDLSINNKVLPEVDISYFFTPEIAAELVLTYPQKQTVRSGGTNIGTLKHLPPTLTMQYHFTGLGAIKPYVGAGLNYTHFSNVSFYPSVAALSPSISKHSWGLALQVGADYAIAKNTYLNIDVKKVKIASDIRSAGTKIGELKIDPWLVGVGIGWRF